MFYLPTPWREYEVNTGEPILQIFYTSPCSVDDIPIGMAIGRFHYTARRELQRPFLFRPLMLDVPEPSDADIVRMLGEIRL